MALATPQAETLQRRPAPPPRRSHFLCASPPPRQSQHLVGVSSAGGESPAGAVCGSVGAVRTGAGAEPPADARFPGPGAGGGGDPGAGSQPGQVHPGMARARGLQPARAGVPRPCARQAGQHAHVRGSACAPRPGAAVGPGTRPPWPGPSAEIMGRPSPAAPQPGTPIRPPAVYRGCPGPAQGRPPRGRCARGDPSPLRRLLHAPRGACLLPSLCFCCALFWSLLLPLPGQLQEGVRGATGSAGSPGRAERGQFNGERAGRVNPAPCQPLSHPPQCTRK